MEKQEIIKLCDEYGIVPKHIEMLRMNDRVLAKIDSDQVYFLKGEKADEAYWETCCIYSNFLLEHGMNVTQYVKSNNDTYAVEVGGKVFSLERSLAGEPIEVLMDSEIMEIGRSLGIQHSLSIKYPTPFHIATSWSLFGGNQTDEIGDYDENELSFLDFKKCYVAHPLFLEIESLYQEYRQSIYKLWDVLPQGAVQGDFCYYNMLQEKNGSIAIYDFNLAGNEVYLNECIAVGVYHAWHAPYKGELNEEERFQVFIDSYINERPFNEMEQAASLPLKAIIRAFRYDRIEDGISLKDEDEQKQFLQDTLLILEGARS